MADKGGKGKRKRKKHPSSKKYKMYTVVGDKITARKRMCPRCGPGIFLAVAPNRVFCGKCAYTEFQASTPSTTAKKK
jgi:ubiquitin-small subunit ribosomal protein S27Ae